MSQALAAASQQTPSHEPSVAAAQCHTMPEIRREIDRVDRALIQLLAERLTYIERAGVIKKDRNSVRDEARIQDVLTKVRLASETAGVPTTITDAVWRTLMERCIAHEFAIWDQTSKSAER